uniref:C3H1-type domain-containing protein n=2 Tax=Globodera pallida TaxID=36090 RepID=A0A183BHZ3_GLOPA
MDQPNMQRRNLMRGQCRNLGDTCPDGPHSTLMQHQMPVCDYYLRMCCSKGKDQCPYLHVKHTDGMDPCDEFNKGCCQQGVMCNLPHRYRYHRIKEKQMERSKLSREHVKKRKASTSEGSDELGSGREEQQQTENIAASRQRRTAAMKSHKVWDVLKPGAKGHAEGETDPNEAQPASKMGRPTPKRKAQGVSSVVSPTEENVKMEIEPSTEIQQGQQEEKIFAQQSDQKGSQRIVLNRKVAAASLSATNLWTQPQPAKDRGQLQLIEKEVEKHQQFADDPMTNTEEPSDEEDEDRMSPQGDRVLLDDPNDEDYPELPSRAVRRGRGEGQQRGRGGGRGSRGGTTTAAHTLRGTTSTRGRPRGSRMPMGGGVMGGRVNFTLGTGRGGRVPMGYYPPPRGSFGPGGTPSIYSIQPSGGIVGDLPLRPPSVRIVRARPAGEVAVHQQNASSGFRPLSVRPSPMVQYNEESFKINRELENYRDSVVPGTSVQQFNDIIDQLLDEMSRAAEDRDKLTASHREYVDHLQLTHSAAQEIKDKRIRQLEQSLDQMQQKLMLSLKNEQLHLVKNTVEGSSQERGGGVLERQSSEHQQLSQDSARGGGVGDSGPAGGGGALNTSSAVSSVPSQMENLRPAGTVVRHMYPIGQNVPQNQRVRIAIGSAVEGGEGAGQQQAQLGLNSPYDDDYEDDELDDEEEFEYDEGDSADIDDDLGAQVTI